MVSKLFQLCYGDLFDLSHRYCQEENDDDIMRKLQIQRFHGLFSANRKAGGSDEFVQRRKHNILAGLFWLHDLLHL